MKTSPVPLRGRTMAVAAMLAAIAAPGASAVEGPPTVLECEQVGAFVSQWLVAGEPLTRVVVKGEVAALASEGDLGYTTVCRPPALRVVCIEQSAAGLAVGDAVMLEGVVGRADAAELVLDPCGAILQK